VSFSGEGMVRPTASRAREAILSMIAPHSATHTFVDLFAGSGVMGFCAWSIGFPRVVMLEQDLGVCADLTDNAERLGAKPEILCDDVERMESLPVGSPLLVYADPPFGRGDLYGSVLTHIAQWDAFDEASMCLIESECNLELHPPSGLIEFSLKKYGRVKVTFFRRAGGI